METIVLDKNSRMASYQERLPDKAVRCLLCPHHCLLQEGKLGICRTRLNREGILYTLAYGNPCSVSVDPIEKKPLFHFFPGTKIYSLATAGCNFRCLNCQNWQISQASPQSTGNYDLLPEDLIKDALRHGTNSIAFTYTEPTVFYEYVYDTARAAPEKGLKTVLISNGFINEKPLLDLCPFLDAANIDLKCFDDAIYHRLTGGRLQPVLDTLKILKEQGVWLEITNLLIPGYTDNPEMIHRMCDWLVENDFEDTPIHFSRFFPTFQLPEVPPTPESILQKAAQIARKAGMNYVYIGNHQGLQRENTSCPACNQQLIERTGFVVSKNLMREGCCGFCGEKIAGVWG